jgi:predicted enzyme related to lactoylglutathione lyase
MLGSMNDTSRSRTSRRYAPLQSGGRVVMDSLRSVEPGAPAWVGLGTTRGTGTAARFYCGLFGWSVVARHRPLDDSVGYWIFRQDGRDVGGLAPDGSSAWTVYMSVSDVDAAAQAVTDHGGVVLEGPMAIIDAGRLALCADPLGAVFALWQPDGDVEAGAVDEPGSCTWYQLSCCDAEVAGRFYGAVFGWEARTTELAGGSTYTEFFHPGTERRVAGMFELDESRGTPVGDVGDIGDAPNASAQWMIHFAVPDADHVAARAAELGGMVSVAPFDLPGVGRIAVLNDPESAVFSVLQAA